VLRPLGAGASSRVFLVEDLHAGRALRALKALARGGDAALLRSEFAELSCLHHPNLAAVHEIDRVTAAGGDPAWALERGASFLTADFIDGVPADQGADAMSDPTARGTFAIALATGAARALAFVHAHGLVHRDVKPDNLLVPRGGGPGAVMLVDFGLSTRAAAHGGVVAGSLPFLAPEALAGEARPESDLYALGVVLYRVLAGVLPYEVGSGAPLGPVLHAIVTGTAPPVEARAGHVDPRLARIVTRLLQPDAARRYVSARSLLADLARLSGEGAAEPAGVVDAESETETPEARAGYVRSAGLVGRRVELERASAALGAALRGDTGPVVWIAGAPGSGRSRLIREAARRILLEAAASGTAAPTLRTGSAQRLAADLGGAASPEALGERLVAQAQTGPLLVHLEDADEPAARALAEYLARGAEPRPPLALAAEASAAPASAGSSALVLGALAAEDVATWVAGVMGAPAPPAFVKALHRATGGLPLLVEQALLAMVRTHPIAELPRAPVPRLDVPESLQAAMNAEVRALPAELGSALAALAALGRPARATELASVVGVEVPDAARAIRELARRGAAIVDDEGRASAREPAASAALRVAGDDVVAGLHRAALGAALREGPGAIEEQARHAVGAGLGEEAATILLDAGRAARERGQLDAAIRRAAGAAERLRGSRRAEALLLRARAEARAGSYDDARATLGPLTKKDETAALLDADVARRSGDVATAGRRLAALQGAKEPSVALEARALAARLALDAGRVDDAAAGLGADDPSASPSARAAHAETLGLLRLRQSDPVAAERAFDDAAARGREAHDPRLEARAHSLAGTALHLRGEASAAARRYEEAAVRASAAGDVHGEATYVVNLGSSLVDAGEYGQALTAFRRGIAMLARLGATRARAGALVNYASLLWFLGDLEGAEGANGRADAAAREVGDAIVLGYVAMNLGELARRRGDVRAARERTERARALFEEAQSPRDRAFACVQLAEIALAEHDLDEASRARDAARAAAGDSPQGELAVRIGLFDARWLAATADPARGEEEAMRALEAARAIGHRDLALRAAGVAARLAASRGDAAGVSRAARTARELQDTLIRSVPDPYRDAFLADPERRAAAEAAATLPTTTGSARTASTPGGDDELWRRLALVTRRITSELRLPILLEYILDTAIELLSADRGFVLLRGRDGAMTVRSARNISRTALDGANGGQLSRSIAAAVAESGEPAVVVDALADGRFVGAQSVQALKLRSILVVPLRVREVVLGALYLDDRFRPGAFSPSDVELAQELADQAAIGIENARLHAENRRRARRIEALNRRLERTVESQRTALEQMRGQLDKSLEALETKYRYEEIVGRSAAMRDLLGLLDRVTDSEVPVVIQGESGTGKELVARAVHFNGARRGRPFVAVNCGAFTETLLESELFGHVRGAFTGADRARAGLFEAAHQGTLFLDEVTEMSTTMQSKLLRALQEGEVRPVGGNETRKVDVRVMTASNRDLAAAVKDGRFREDLYYRLTVITLKIPPLRERREDVPVLIEHFLKKHGAGRAPSVDKKALGRLMTYSWPGNVRQLENEMMRLLVLADDTVREEHLSPEIAAGATDEDPTGDDLDLKTQVERVERRLLRRALRESKGNQTKAARALGLSRFGLQKKLRRYGMA
jgi:transcriptional regulator with GAF, ATPase, and Fis domain